MPRAAKVTRRDGFVWMVCISVLTCFGLIDLDTQPVAEDVHAEGWPLPGRINCPESHKG